MSALFASAIVLSGCGATTETPDTTLETESTNENTGIIETTELTQQELIEMPEQIENESGQIITVTGENTTTSQIKAMIDKRREEMKNETGNSEELNEKDIEFLESILAKIAQKK